MKLKLDIDLITVNCDKVDEGIKTLNYCSKNIEFNNIFLLTHKEVSGNFNLIKINKNKDIVDYNNQMVQLHKLVKSEYCLIVQHDGHILNHRNWSNQFFDYDYIGAPWPNSESWKKRWIKYPENIKNNIYKNIDHNRVGNGGFSLRSKRYLDYCSTFEPDFLKHGVPEDIFLNLVNYEKAKDSGMKYPDVKTAIKFSYETPLKGQDLADEKKYHILNKQKHFGWHGNYFLNKKKLLKTKYM
jgi:hypothetical protein